MILDVYHRSFFVDHQGDRVFAKADLDVRERKIMQGNRLKVRLDYSGQATGDSFDWRLYTPHELRELAETTGFRWLHACSDFDENTEPSPTKPRMQLVLENVQ